jgi:hypothetical protein
VNILFTRTQKTATALITALAIAAPVAGANAAQTSVPRAAAAPSPIYPGIGIGYPGLGVYPGVGLGYPGVGILPGVGLGLGVGYPGFGYFPGIG